MGRYARLAQGMSFRLVGKPGEDLQKAVHAIDEAALARLKRKRSEAVARGNRTRAAKNRARVIEKAQAMRAALESKAGEDAETTADEITGTDAAQMPLGLG